VRVWLENIYRQWWIFLCGVPVIALTLYQLFKSRLVWHFAANLGRPNAVHLDALIMIVLGLIGTLAAVIFYRSIRNVVTVLVAGSTIVSSIGVWLQKDRSNAWIGADVPTNNYSAALLALEIGSYELVNTWNARGNPYADSNEIPHPEEVVQKIEKLKLGWLMGNRWQIRDLPQNNNRMHQHPPGYPLVLAGWLRVFGASRISAQWFELCLKLLVIILAAWWIWQRIPKGEMLSRIVVFLLLSTAPPVILFFEPHANELATIFAVLAFMILEKSAHSHHRIALNIVAGVLLAFAAYTNFFNMLLLIVMLAVFALSKEAWRSWIFPGVLGGSALVILVFCFIGYYPWLTYVTGSHLTYYYRLSNPFDLLSSVLDFLYFGFPLLLITILSLFASRRVDNRFISICTIGVLITLVIGVYQSFALASTSRYLMGMLFLLLPVICISMSRLNFTLRQAMIIPIVNYMFVLMVLFL